MASVIFSKRDDFASETDDAPAYSYWKSVMRQFFKKEVSNCHVGNLAIILMSFIYPMFSRVDLMMCLRLMIIIALCIKRSIWFGTAVIVGPSSIVFGFGARNSILIAVIATFLNVVIGFACQVAVWDF